MIVCLCNRLTEKDVRQAAGAGALSPEKAYASFDCEVQCACCLDYAQEILDDEVAARPRLRLVASNAA